MNIEKLPKWAQKHIETLERERDNAERALTGFLDDQTESDFYYDNYDGKNHTRRYVQTRGVTVEAAGIALRVFVPNGMHGREGIEISFGPIRGAQRLAVIQPNASNSITIRKVEEPKP